jgi:hypothetical protein
MNTFNGTDNSGRPRNADGTPKADYSVRKGDEGTATVVVGPKNDRGDVTALQVSGTIAPSLVYRGRGLSTAIVDDARHHKVDIDMSLNTANGRETLVFNKDSSIQLFRGGPTAGFHSSIGIGQGSTIDVPADPNVKDGSEKMDIRLGYVVGNSALRGQLVISDTKMDKLGYAYLPTKMSFGGRVERRANGGSPWVDFLRGSINLELLNHIDRDASLAVSETNPLKIKATTNVVVTIPNRPVLNVNNLVVTVEDKGVSQVGTLAGQYRQGSVVIDLNAESKASSDVLTMTSSEGIQLVYDRSKSVHPLTKNGVSVGVYDEVSKKLTYSDSTFEQF